MARAYPGIFLLIAIAGGVLLADATRQPAWIFLFAAFTALLAGALALVIRNALLATLSLGFALTGFSASHFAYDAYDLGPRHLARYADTHTRYRILGRVDDWPNLRPDRLDLTIRIDSLGVDSLIPASGRILLKLTDTAASVQSGDRVEFYARLYPVADGGEAAAYGRSLQLKRIHALAYLRSRSDLRRQERPPLGLIPIVDTIRTALSQSLARTLHPRSASLAGGFLIGETRDIPPDIYRAFRDSGTLHLLAVSGSNVALVIGFVMVLLRPFRTGRPWRTVLLLTALVLFALLCRGEPSVVRASVMAALVLLARLVGRRINLNNIVALAAAGILLLAPTQLFDVGFQLSFATAWGLVFVTPKLYHLTDRRFLGPVRRWFLLALIVSLAAQLFSAPLIAYYFHRIPLITTLANLIIVPLVSVAVIGVLITLMFDFLWPPLAALSGTLLDRLMDLILVALYELSGPRALLLDTGEIPGALVVAAYVGLIFAGWALTAVPLRRWVLLGALVVLNLGLIRLIAFPAPNHLLTLHINRVPGGLAAVIVPDSGRRADLIITGLAVRDYPVAERVLTPWLERLGVDRLHRVALFAADYDAAAGLVHLADSLHAETLYVHRRLAATLADISASSAHPLPWRAFGDTAAPTAEALTLLEWGAVLSLNGSELLFLPTDAGLATAAACPTIRTRWLVCGDEVEVADLSVFNPRLAGLVCAEFDQDAAMPPAPPVLDLTRTGTVVLQLSAERPGLINVRTPD